MKSTEVTSRNQRIFELGLEHIAELRKLESSCFDYYWTEEQFRLGLEKNAFYVLGYVEKGILVGYLAYSLVLEEMEVLNLGVHPDFRRSGIGRSLMLDLMQRCREMNIKRGLLDVKETNHPAIALYESLGFVQVGIRKKYYPDTKEDALLYDLEF
ncbi:ribosomal protein S18-alanine N-acetyltransferase [Maridesulfovibrio hydrothermalis]|uniref:[Ribosomal protein bS18]-alanine N-acetyltransferase n=1 Tax=Maridesulfovibrio hydrothermalis AM13 = DSM 14728 TaxID=1121451 RepID=L0REG7_9BACT|nr:ribosomal protein S18-alanine N-acetyltransferase [Maridesulfovibrio hydrothermalis]CCO24585.1 Ribosomal-protein-alanine acetyltransferase [Maridesulfovibrio hydrothermalis AM13 = DSM 14728]